MTDPDLVLNKDEREFVRREYRAFLGDAPSITKGFQVKRWSTGPHKGEPKLSAAVQGLLDRGLITLEDVGFWPKAKFTDRGFMALKLMAADRRALHPAARISVWAYDEHRIGLKPILRKIWAPKGKRPVAIGAHRFKWMYLYAFVRPDTGELVWFVFNTVNVKAFSASLAAFAKEIGAGKDHQVIIVLDNAGWHVSKDLIIPEGIHLSFLPPYTPELQPAERLWPLSNEGIANTYFETINALSIAQAQRCRELCEQPELVRSYTKFHWWPTAA